MFISSSALTYVIKRKYFSVHDYLISKLYVIIGCFDCNFSCTYPFPDLECSSVQLCRCVQNGELSIPLKIHFQIQTRISGYNKVAKLKVQV